MVPLQAKAQALCCTDRMQSAISKPWNHLPQRSKFKVNTFILFSNAKEVLMCEEQIHIFY